jgi:tetratricopeptide (TPR) repeat protein
VAQPVTYTFGGTVQAGGGVYIPRGADGELLKLCQDAVFAYVLTPRQMGKSSLMVQTAQTLSQEGVRAVIVDLQELGAQVTAEQWYFGFLVKLDDQLMFEEDVVSWWQQHEHLGVSQRLTLFFEKVLLAEVKERIVIFVDEIDSTLSLDFTDDFFTAVRYLYVARATNPEFQRLSFVLMGVATPGDLIRDARRTPFNIGHRVDLIDFTFEEALALADGLGLPSHEAEQVLRWVLKWTGGHPYLTQRLCGAISEQVKGESLKLNGKSPSVSEMEVDQLVNSKFFGVMSEQDNNLQFVRDMLTKRAPQGLEKEVLSVYRDIRRGKRQVVDEEQSLVKSHLKLSGVVRREGNTLVVRNAIYRHVFDQHWVWEHFPENLWQRLKPALPLIATLSVFSIFMTALAWYAFDRTREAERLTREANKEKANAELVAQTLNAENLFVSGANGLDALIESLRAAQQLKQLDQDAEKDARMRTVLTLQEVVYDLDPKTPAIDKNPQAVAKKLVVKALIQQGEELAKQGNVKKGIEKFTQAQKLDSSLKIPAESWGSICVMGSLYNQARDVMFACEKAVALASKKEQAGAKAVRGLAKALTGDKLGAIADFDVYLQSKEIPDASKKQVQGWVNALRAGKNPFTPEELKKLRGG